VYSELGKGTSFKIYLPRVEAVAPRARPARAAAEVTGTETILVVEDEQALRHVATRILQSAGYTVLMAGSGEEALLLLERHDGPVHLMMTDVVMPGMSGRNLASSLAEVHPEIKVLYASGYTDDTILRHGVLEEATHFIGKPHSRATLTRKVREVLDGRG
jgi:DNA-binding NtrC family response regulator